MNEADIIKKLDALRSSGKSQDPLDAIGGELFVATIIKRYGDKRYKNAVEHLTDFAPDKVRETKELATKREMKTEAFMKGAEYIVGISCNAPAERLDAKQFYNELIKLGVKKEIVDKAQAAAMKQSAPATSFSAASV